MSNEKRKLNPGEHLVAGTLAGLVSTTLLFPLDTIKVRYQVDESATLRNPKRLLTAFRTIIEREGWQGMYQGLPAGLYGSGLSWGGYFYFYEHAKLRWLSGNDRNAPNTAFHHLAASCEAGSIMVALTNPIWLVKTRMQLQLREIADTGTSTGVPRHPSNDGVLANAAKEARRPYKSFTDALVTIVREEGPLALYKGSLPALMLVSHGAVQFVIYERLKSEAALTNSLSFLGSANFLVLGAASKVVATISTYPLQVIKTRLQQRRVSDDHERAHKEGASESQSTKRKKATWSSGRGLIMGTRAQYQGVVDCVRKTFANEGMYGFFKGCLPNAIRVAPGAAVTFFTYETVADALRLRS
mmetsp:Transcript_24229/g.41052  ORF Transcript_24229/g.41052 Transcript_24229/m.41052 type:complete len:357 (+) Transcript_24229:65-1135(+)